MKDEWYTPCHIIEAVRSTMGSIDLDPASCEEANLSIKAKRIYTKRDDGLMQTWTGNVWCNPPFSNDGASLFFYKAVSEFRVGNINQGCILISISGKSLRTVHAFQMSSAVCILDPNTRFTGNCSGLSDKRHPYLTIVCYLGPSIEVFCEHFKGIGPIVRCIQKGPR